MSKVAIKGASTGTGTFTIESPATNTDRVLVLPDAAGTIALQGGAISGTTGTFTGLLDISAAGAGQIQFPATQNASANANTLDDYEEGAFTPITTAGGGAVGAYITQVGLYTKVGNIVRANVSVSVNKNTATGALTISGLPFAASGFQRGLAGVDWFVPGGTAFVNCTVFVNSGTTTLRVCPITAASVDATSNDIQWSQVATTVTLSCSFVYQV